MNVALADDKASRITPAAAATELINRKKARETFHDFVRQSWPVIEGGREFVDGWHIGALAEHLQAVMDGEIQNLVVNVPPRSMKSTIVSVQLPAWVWITRPNFQWLFTAYAQGLSLRDSLKCRRLIESGWYQVRWGDKYQLTSDQNTKLRFENDATGYRIASSVDGVVTGEGGDVIVADDPNSANAVSDTMLDTTNTWWDHVMGSRLNDIKTGHRIVIQQRLHERDLTGHILSKTDDSWVHLMLPMEFEKARACITVPLMSTGGKPWKDPRTEEGELMWPDRWGDGEVKKLKSDLASEYAVAGQLQQRPAPADGGIIKKSWFQWWKHPVAPKCNFIVQSWDTALGVKDKNAYTAATTWGVFDDGQGVPNIILLNAWRVRWEYPDIRRIAQRMAVDYLDDDLNHPIRPPKEGKKPNRRCDMILIEAKMNGFSLIQDLSRAGIIPTKFNPDKHGDKIQRVRIITHIIEAGRVWVPTMPPSFTQLRPYADLLVNQCAVFPNAESRDLVDTMTQALIRLSQSGWVYNPADAPPSPPPNMELRQAFY